MKNGGYNAVEQKFLDYIDNVIKPASAASTDVNVPVATEEAIKIFSEWADPWNPVFHDPEYGKQTKYGSIIAPPHFMESISSWMMWPMQPETGFMDHDYAGDYYEYFKPVKPGDSFTIRRDPVEYEEISEDFGGDLRTFAFFNNRCHVFGSDGEPVANLEMILNLILRPEPNYVDLSKVPFEDHIYTDSEWEWIRSIIAGEKIRGAKPRYWEDVHAGDELPPVTIGPTTIWDMVAFFAARHELPFHPSRWFRDMEHSDVLLDPKTNNYFVPVCWHFDRNRANLMGNPRPFNFGGSAACQMIRCVTNWMGDDAEFRGLNWRHLIRTPHGDCLVGSGKVIKKYVKNGEPVVDIFVSLLNECRGNLSEAAVITVALPSKNQVTDVDSIRESIDIDGVFELGDRVRIMKDPNYVFPTGYPLHDAEGIVENRYPWQVISRHKFGGFTSIRITKADTPLGLGDIYFVPTDILEKR